MTVRRRNNRHRQDRMMGNHDFLKRITKSLYYGKLPSLPCLSLPVMELSTEIFSEAQKGKSLKRLYLDDAAELTRNACVSPCSLVLALLYLERLKTCNPDYVSNIAPAELFLVSLMVSNKFLQDDGEEDEVIPDEWAASAGISLVDLNQMERDFLHAIDWRVFVDESSFEITLKWLEHQIAIRQAKTRGWFTYTDLANISNPVENIGLLKCLATVYMALSLSYIANVCTLVASSLIVSQSLQTILVSDNLPGVFNYTNQLANVSVPSQIYSTVSDDLLDYANLLKQSNEEFVKNNEDYMKRNHYETMSQTMEDLKRSYLPFFETFLQPVLRKKIMDCPNDWNSYRDKPNIVNESHLDIIYDDHSFVFPVQWSKLWSKPVLC